MAIKFTCPKCNHHELGSIEQIIMTYPITLIPENGNLEYDSFRFWIPLRERPHLLKQRKQKIKPGQDQYHAAGRDQPTTVG